MPPRNLRPIWLAPASAILFAGASLAWGQSTQDLQQIQEQIDQGKIEASELKQKAEDLARDVERLQQRLTRFCILTGGVVGGAEIDQRNCFAISIFGFPHYCERLIGDVD